MAIKSMARKNSNVRSESERGHQSRIWIYLFLLTLQYGAQPLLSKRFTGKEVIVTTSVLVCEWAKVLCALILILREGSLGILHKEWTLIGSLTASALPAAIYALQNSLLQVSYRNLDSLTFTMLNQTKLFFTALFMYLILGQKQTLQQVGALVLLVIAALLLSIGEHSGHGSKIDREQAFLMGIIPVIVASVLSGVASSLCQWASQVKKRSSYLMTIEMSVIGSLCLLASTLKSPDGKPSGSEVFLWVDHINSDPNFHQCSWWDLSWTRYNTGWWCPKGFVIVSALMVTALLQFIFDGIPPSSYVLFALPLVVSSIVVYQKYQFQAKTKTS